MDPLIAKTFKPASQLSSVDPANIQPVPQTTLDINYLEK